MSEGWNILVVDDEPPISLAQVHINGGCHRDAELLQHILGLLLDGRVHTEIERHCFFHGYHLGFIVTYFALQVNSR